GVLIALQRGISASADGRVARRAERRDTPYAAGPTDSTRHPRGDTSDEASQRRDPGWRHRNAGRGIGGCDLPSHGPRARRGGRRRQALSTSQRGRIVARSTENRPRIWSTIGKETAPLRTNGAVSLLSGRTEG